MLENYTDDETVNALLDGGDISSLRANVGEKHDFDNYNGPQRDNEWTTYYGRDRGEKGVEIRTYTDFTDVVKDFADSWCEWFYVFVDGRWLYTDIRESELPTSLDDLKPLTPEACEDNVPVTKQSLADWKDWQKQKADEAAVDTSG